MRNYDKAIVTYESIIQKDSIVELPKFEFSKLYHKSKKALQLLKNYQNLSRNTIPFLPLLEY
jgi:hypothetical protein